MTQTTVNPAQLETDQLTWNAQPKQAAFHRRTEDEVLYGGAAFGGKSEALLMFSIRRREKWPGSDGMIIRRSFADLIKPGALIDRSHEILANRRGVAWDGQNHRWRFANGSLLAFGYLDSSNDRLHYQGASIEDICWDELTQIAHEDDYLFVNAFCRSKLSGCRPLVRAATNPGEIGHGWVRRRFVNIAPPLTTYTDPTSGRTRCYIPATLEDNPAGLAINPDYERNLASLPPAMHRALRYGDWDIFAGQVFSEWRRDIHVVPPFAIPADWTRWIAVDYGYVAPFCAGWLARNPQRTRIVIYREAYETGYAASDQAALIRTLSERENIRFGLADPSMWAQREGRTDVQARGRRQTVGGSYADDYAQAWQGWGVPLHKANNNRIQGKNHVHQALAYEVSQGGALAIPPLLQVFESCVNLIRTLPELVYDKYDVEDVDTKGEDHAYDMVRYGLTYHYDRRQREAVPVQMRWVGR